MLALLAIAQVRIKVGPIITKPIRAMCNSGSQLNHLNEVIVQTDLLPTKHCSIRVIGINSVTRRLVTKNVCCQLLSRFSDTPIAEIELLVVENLQ